MADNAVKQTRKQRRTVLKPDPKWATEPHIPTSDNRFTFQTSTISASDIPMSQPDRTGPKSKTLFELASDRQAELDRESGRTREGTDLEPVSDQAIDTAIETLLAVFTYTATLSMLHFTFDLLVIHQYSQVPPEGIVPLLPQLLKRLGTIAPVLAILIFIMHSPLFPFAKWQQLRQIMFCIASSGAGCYMVHIGNQEPYLAVMKQAPPIGVVWVWCVLELGLTWALASLSFVAAFTMWNGFSVM